MNSSYTRALAGMGVVAALAFPAVSAAKGPHGHGHGHKGAGNAAPHQDAGKQHGHKQKGRHTRSLIVVGVVSAVGTDGTVQVDVKHANHHGAGLVGQTVTFDVSNARIVVSDVNGDGKRDLSDVAVGDRVLLRARVAKGETLDPTATITALGLIDKGTKPPADGGPEPSGSTDSNDSNDSNSGGNGSDSSTPPANG